MKRNVFVVRFKFRCNILISGKIIKEMPGSVASGTPCTTLSLHKDMASVKFIASQANSNYQYKNIRTSHCTDI